MKKFIGTSIVLVIFVLIFVWYGESRRTILTSKNGIKVTVWKTYNNSCYIIIGKYQGLFTPDKNHVFIKTANTAGGVDLIFQNNSNTVIAQVERGSMIHNSSSSKLQIVDYELKKMRNDSLFTYFDNKIKINRYKPELDVISIPIDDRGAL